MIPSQVNRARALGALALSLSCAPANNGKQGTGNSSTRADTAVVAAKPAPPDPAIAKADLARIQGRADAPLWVIEVSDFQCPFCKQWHEQTYSAFRDEYVKTGKVRMAYVNFPLNSHPFAWPSAESAMCAGAQGKFWEMHDKLFATQTQWGPLPSPTNFFDSLARSSGVDIAQWRECVSSGRMKPIIQADHDRASQAGARATPSFMIGNQIFTGAQPIEELRRIVDSALVKAGKTTP
jgi:protein-disulfide isomerase